MPMSFKKISNNFALMECIERMDVEKTSRCVDNCNLEASKK